MTEYEETAKKHVKLFLLYLVIPAAIIITGVVLTSRRIAEAYPNFTSFGWACIILGTTVFTIFSNAIFTQIIVSEAVEEIKGETDGNPNT